MILFSKRKRGMSLLEVAIVFGILGILLTIAAYSWLLSRARVRATTCIENQAKIMDAVQQWALQTGAAIDAKPSYPELIG